MTDDDYKRALYEQAKAWADHVARVTGRAITETGSGSQAEVERARREYLAKKRRELGLPEDFE
jgi:hypothetical protein